ncbi:MAG: hypothetical protein ACPHK6_02960 [Ilumatobacteraceae bacterium]
MSGDDVNQLTPDDGDLDEAVVARLRSALLNDVVVNDTERDHTIASVLAALDNDSQAPVVNIESRRRFRSQRVLQFAAAVLTVAIGAGALLQLRSGQSDTAELSVQESSRERSEENLQSESEEFAFAEESAMEESAVEAAPEIESMGDTALGSDLSGAEDELMADDMAAVAESATEEMAGDVYELESISLDELPNFIRNALEQGATTIPSAAFCEIDNVELLTEVILDEIIVVVARMTGLNKYLAIDVATCEVLAEIDLGDE